MTKVAYNSCYGGFSLSHDAVMAIAKRKGVTLYATVPGQQYKDKFPATAETIKKALIVSYYTTPTFQEDSYWPTRDFSRTDPDLIAVIEELGTAANGRFADIKIRDVPKGSRYRIDEYDGNESVTLVDEYDWEIA